MNRLLEGFEVVKLSEGDAVVQERMEAFYQRVGLAKPWHHPALSWLGLAKDGAVKLVIAAFVRGDSSVEITDFYPVPSRDGVKAGYVGLKMLKMLVDEGVIPYWLGNIVAPNKSGQRRAERYFSIEPVGIIYRYGKALV